MWDVRGIVVFFEYVRINWIKQTLYGIFYVEWYHYMWWFYNIIDNSIDLFIITYDHLYYRVEMRRIWKNCISLWIDRLNALLFVTFNKKRAFTHSYHIINAVEKRFSVNEISLIFLFRFPFHLHKVCRYLSYPQHIIIFYDHHRRHWCLTGVLPGKKTSSCNVYIMHDNII